MQSAHWRTVVALLFLVCGLVVSAGCKEPNFGNKLSTRQEIQIGDQAAAELEAQYPPVVDPAVDAPVQSVTERIFPQAAKLRGDITYRIKVLPNTEINAFSLPGGRIYITTGMLDKLGSNQDMLAAVIAHEAAHAALRHAANQIVDAVGQDDLIDMLSEGKYTDIANLTLQLDQSSHSLDDEYQADRYGVQFTSDSGYNPEGLLRFFTLMQSVPDDSEKPAWLETHPLTKGRIARAEADIRELTSDKR
jgi:predicted Zn-dependent protease